MRIDFDEMMAKRMEVPVEMRGHFSPRAYLEMAFGFELTEVTVTKRRITVTFDSYYFDVARLAKHTFILNKRELEIHKLSKDNGVAYVQFAAKDETRGMNENSLRHAAAVGLQLLASHERFERYSGSAEERKAAREAQVKALTPNVDPTSVLIEEESADRLAYLVEQKLGQCLDEPRRSAKVEGRKVVYTDRESARV